MPSTGNSIDLARVYASAPAGVDLWPTLTLSHSAWHDAHGNPTPYYLTSAPEPFSAVLETGDAVTFAPFPFAAVLPTVDASGQQDLQVTLTNADPLIAQAVALAHADPSEPIEVTYRLFLSTGDATRTPQAAPLRLSFASIQVTDEAVSGVAGRSDVLNRRFPAIWYDVAHFPGLDR